MLTTAYSYQAVTEYRLRQDAVQSVNMSILSGFVCSVLQQRSGDYAKQVNMPISSIATSQDRRDTEAPSLLVVDDDRELCQLVADYLKGEGFLFRAVHTGGDGIRAVHERRTDLVILDVMLPDMKGFEVLRAIRKDNQTPVLMLTAKGDELDRIIGLELGADDYLPKPFNPRELVARISAILRRSGWQANASAERPSQILCEDIVLDPASRMVQRNGTEVRLTSAEFDLLAVFLKALGKVLSRETLVEDVLERHFSPFDRSIDLHVSNLRRKLGPRTNGTDRIRSVRGSGYLYVWPETSPRQE